MKMSKALLKSLAESELSVFWPFTTLLLFLQKQMDRQYHTENLGDITLAAVDIQASQTQLGDRMTTSTYQPVNMTTNKLLDKSHTTESSSSCTILEKNDYHEEEAVHHPLWNTSVGDVRRTAKMP